MWQIHIRFLITALALVGSLASGASAADRLNAGSPAPRLIPVAPASAKIAADDSLTERLPPIEQPIQKISFVEPVPEPISPAIRAAPVQPIPGAIGPPEEVQGRATNEPEPFLIDLPTSLRLADASNLQMAFARTGQPGTGERRSGQCALAAFGANGRKL